MTAGKEQTGWKIAVIILAVLTVALGVSTYIVYDKYRTEIDKTDAAIKEREKSVKERDAFKVNAGRLKEMVAKGPDESVDLIMQEFNKDQATYGITLPDDSAKDYPTMLESHADQIRELQEQIVSLQIDLENKQDEYAQGVTELKDQIAVLQEKFDGQAADIRLISENAEETTKNYQENMEAASAQVEEKNEIILANKQERDSKESDLRTRVRQQSDENEVLIKELLPHREWRNEPPDGEVVRINQRTGTVFIGLGRADGLRRQTSFSVLPHDAKNALDVDPKGSLEVVSIIGPHLAEARITSDILSDPILPGDKIVSPIFRAGQPERFGVAGAIDINGDGTSDLRQLLALIKRNGGAVDVYADDDGRQSGTMTISTKFLIIGERPNEKSDKAVLDSYRKLLDSADEHGVGRMPLADFLDYVGYQGRTGVAERPVVSSKSRGEKSSFRRRPAARDAKKSAFD